MISEWRSVTSPSTTTPGCAKPSRDQRSAYYSDPDLIFRPDADVQLRYAVDYALRRPDVSPEHFSLTGYDLDSLAGHGRR